MHFRRCPASFLTYLQPEQILAIGMRPENCPACILKSNCKVCTFLKDNLCGESVGIHLTHIAAAAATSLYTLPVVLRQSTKQGWISPSSDRSIDSLTSNDHRLNRSYPSAREQLNHNWWDESEWNIRTIDLCIDVEWAIYPPPPQIVG